MSGKKKCKKSPWGWKFPMNMRRKTSTPLKRRSPAIVFVRARVCFQTHKRTHLTYIQTYYRAQVLHALTHEYGVGARRSAASMR